MTHVTVTVSDSDSDINKLVLPLVALVCLNYRAESIPTAQKSNELVGHVSKRT
jgi:hypothetical protein